MALKQASRFLNLKTPLGDDTLVLTGFDLAIAAPQDFLAMPGDWMRWVSDFRGTIICGRQRARGPRRSRCGASARKQIARWSLPLTCTSIRWPTNIESEASRSAPFQ